MIIGIIFRRVLKNGCYDRSDQDNDQFMFIKPSYFVVLLFNMIVIMM